MKVELCADF